MSASARASDCARSDNCVARHADRRRDIEPLDAAKQTMQLVAIEIADETRRIEQRPRPARRGGVDDAERVAALLGIGSDHDRDVMIGQRHRQPDPGNDIKRQQFDAGFFQQEFDRRVAAHVDRGRERQHAQSRLFRRTWRAEQLMKGQHFRLDRQPRLLVAQKLRDQRQIEPLAGVGRSVGDLRDQFVPQRTKIGAAERHRRQPGESDPVRAQRLGRLRSAHRDQAACKNSARWRMITATPRGSMALDA